MEDIPGKPDSEVDLGQGLVVEERQLDVVEKVASQDVSSGLSFDTEVTACLNDWRKYVVEGRLGIAWIDTYSSKGSTILPMLRKVVREAVSEGVVVEINRFISDPWDWFSFISRTGLVRYDSPTTVAELDEQPTSGSSTGAAHSYPMALGPFIRGPQPEEFVASLRAQTDRQAQDLREWAAAHCHFNSLLGVICKTYFTVKQTNPMLRLGDAGKIILGNYGQRIGSGVAACLILHPGEGGLPPSRRYSEAAIEFHQSKVYGSARSFEEFCNDTAETWLKHRMAYIDMFFSQDRRSRTMRFALNFWIDKFVNPDQSTEAYLHNPLADIGPIDEARAVYWAMVAKEHPNWMPT